jgi:hypothetical protein
VNPLFRKRTRGENEALVWRVTSPFIDDRLEAGTARRFNVRLIYLRSFETVMLAASMLLETAGGARL